MYFSSSFLVEWYLPRLREHKSRKWNIVSLFQFPVFALLLFTLRDYPVIITSLFRKKPAIQQYSISRFIVI